MEIDRRDFIRNATFLACAACGLGGLAAVQGCKPLAHLPHTYANGVITVRKSDFAIDARYAIIKVAGLPAPIYLSRTEGGEYTALLMLCTHRECEVRPYGAILHCPCHGSEFDAAGNVLQGPANEPLKEFRTTSDTENIYIQ